MSIFHFTVKIISKSKGQSVIASAAYRSGSELEDRSTGKTHNYTNKTGVDDVAILLPSNAPTSFLNREVLWNSVTEAETKVKDAQLARELEFALPVEWSLAERKEIVTDFIQKNFVDKGMCADIAWHDKHDGNPHVHVLLTMKELDANKEGKWLSKSTKKYLCRKPNEKEERYLDANELKQSVNEGFEKVFKFKPKEQKDNKAYITMTMTEYAEKCSETHVRIGKAPLDKKVERNNWNDKNNVETWRKAWADTCNLHLAVDKQVDHRSYARQGVDKAPTIHEGVAARKMEKEGLVSERCEYNREARTVNRLADAVTSQKKEIEKKVIDTIVQIGEIINGIFGKISRAISEFADRINETGADLDYATAFIGFAGEEISSIEQRMPTDVGRSKGIKNFIRETTGIEREIEHRKSRTDEFERTAEQRKRGTEQRKSEIGKLDSEIQRKIDLTNKYKYRSERELYNTYARMAGELPSLRSEAKRAESDCKQVKELYEFEAYKKEYELDLERLKKYRWKNKEKFKEILLETLGVWNEYGDENYLLGLHFEDYKDFKRNGLQKINESWKKTKKISDSLSNKYSELSEKVQTMETEMKEIEQFISKLLPYAYRYRRTATNHCERDESRMLSYDAAVINRDKYGEYYRYCDSCVKNKTKFNLSKFKVSDIPNSDKSISERMAIAKQIQKQGQAKTKTKKHQHSIDDDWGLDR